MIVDDDLAVLVLCRLGGLAGVLPLDTGHPLQCEKRAKQHGEGVDHREGFLVLDSSNHDASCMYSGRGG